MHCSLLTVLAAGPAHGYLLLERLAGLPNFAGCKPDPTGVYRVLREMEELGQVLGTWENPASGPAKRSYQITTEGLDCLARWVDSLERHQQIVAGLASIARKAVHS